MLLFTDHAIIGHHWAQLGRTWELGAMFIPSTTIMTMLPTMLPTI